MSAEPELMEGICKKIEFLESESQLYCSFLVLWLGDGENMINCIITFVLNNGIIFFLL